MSGDPSIEQIEKAIAELGQEYRAPPGWEDRVRAATRRRRPIRWAAIAAVVAAAAAVLLLWWPDGGRPRSSQPPFQFEIVSNGTPVRGGSTARVGDTLKATVRGGKHRALWLYQGDELVHRCNGPRGCASSDRVISLQIPFESPGSYTLVALRGDGPIPEPQGAFDADVAAADRAGVLLARKRIAVE